MAEFLDTTGVSYRLQQIINNSREKLILISPYLKMNERIKQSLEDQNRLKTDVRLVYGKNDLQPAELNWLKSLREVKSYYCRNLHAKCYLNEKEAIVTSMNLYDFSQVNNLEMGIYVDKTSDADLYHKIYDEAMRMVRMSDEIQITVAQIPKTEDKPLKSSTPSGFCIGCHTEIKLDPKSPYCRDCYKTWKKSGDNEREEKHCHVCGKPNKSTINRPACYDCFKANKNILEFPFQ